MYDKDLQSIEIIEKSDKHYENKIELCISSITNQPDDRIIWTFDTGVSEYITKNKNIFSNFKKENLTSRHVNNSFCKFESIGSFKGSINSFDVNLDNIYTRRMSIKIS